MQMIFDTSAIEQTRGFALFLRSWWMEARDKPAGLRQSATSLVTLIGDPHYLDVNLFLSMTR